MTINIPTELTNKDVMKLFDFIHANYADDETGMLRAILAVGILLKSLESTAKQTGNEKAVDDIQKHVAELT